MSENGNVAVLGFGTMGAGIAQVCAQAGREVVVLEESEERLEDGRRRLETFLEEGVRREKVTEEERSEVLARVRGTTDVGDLAGSGVVIEAVVENLETKRTLLPAVAGVVGESAIMATNTSALSVTELAATVPRPERFGGLHFFNPAPLMKLVEVVAAVQTSEETLDFLESFAKEIGKEPVRTKDRPGFLVNRLLMPYLNQVVQAYDDGLATAEDMDTALERGLGYPMGGLKLLDLIGLDIHLHATSAAYEQTHDPHLAPPPLLSRMVDAGHLGRKTGRGFHDYGDDNGGRS
jgi:3-hydroxybutyryl-CoA dehydrogenase